MLGFELLQHVLQIFFYFNLSKFILENNRIEAVRLFREWERLQYIECNYTTGTPAATKEVKSKGHIVISYTQGLCESIKKICGRYGIQTHFKGGTTIKNVLVSPRTKTLGSTKVMPSIGINVGTLAVMMST